MWRRGGGGVNRRDSRGLIYEYCAGHISTGEESEHEETGDKHLDDKRTMTGYSIQRSPNRKIRRPASSEGRPTGVYTQFPSFGFLHFNTLPFKVGPR